MLSRSLMKVLITIFSIFLSTHLAFSECRKGEFSKVQNYESGCLNFGAFRVNFVGTIKKHYPDDDLDYLNYLFEIEDAEGKQEVRWESAGVILPSLFQIAGEEFALELTRSSALRTRIPTGEFIVWKHRELVGLRDNN